MACFGLLSCKTPRVRTDVPFLLIEVLLLCCFWASTKHRVSALFSLALCSHLAHKASAGVPSLLGPPRCADSPVWGTRLRHSQPPLSLPILDQRYTARVLHLPQAQSRAITLITAWPPRRWRARPRRPENAPGPGPERGKLRALRLGQRRRQRPGPARWGGPDAR